MLGLILKDFMYLKNMFKNLVILFVCTLIVSILSGQYIYLIASIPLMIVSTGINVFQTDEYYNSEMYILSLPFSRKQIIKARYLFTWIIFIIAIVLSLTLFGIVKLFYFNIDNSILYMSIILEVVLLLVDFIFYPIIYKYGCQKSSFIMITFMMVISIIATLLYKLINYLNITIDYLYLLNTLSSYLVLILFIAILVIFITSYLISIKVYRKLDF